MPTRKVIVVGSLHYDIMVKAPDRPRKGETVLGEAWWPKCGGKGGNQAVEAALTGVPTVMVGAVGDDDFGAVLTANLERAGVGTTAVAVHPGGHSGMSVAIQDAAGDYGAVVVSGVNRSVAIGPDSGADWSAGDWLVLQNEISPAANLAAARLARARGVGVLHNAAPALAPDPAFAGLVDLLVVNAIEAEMLGGGVVGDLDGAAMAAERLRRGTRAVIVTAGGDGVAWAGPDGEGRMPAIPVVLRSTHGAGDCFVGVLAAALCRGLPLAEAILAANAAAGALVGLDEAARAARLPPGGTPAASHLPISSHR